MSEASEGKKRHRSPAYPAIGLREAMVRLRRYYAEQKRSLVHLNPAYESLGYKEGSSSGARVVAALISYGLMVDEGTGDTRKVKISDLGYRLSIIDEDDPSWRDWVRESAIKPKLYADLLARWPEALPNDSAIRNYLLLELNFNDEVVMGLIKDFRDTYEYAGLGTSQRESGETVSPQDLPDGSQEIEKNDEVEKTNAEESKTLQREGMRMHTIPLSTSSEALLYLPTGITRAQFQFLKKYLELMEQAITGEPPVFTNP